MLPLVHFNKEMQYILQQSIKLIYDLIGKQKTGHEIINQIFLLKG